MDQGPERASGYRVLKLHFKWIHKWFPYQIQPPTPLVSISVFHYAICNNKCNSDPGVPGPGSYPWVNNLTSSSLLYTSCHLVGSNWNDNNIRPARKVKAHSGSVQPIWCQHQCRDRVQATHCMLPTLPVLGQGIVTDCETWHGEL